MIMIAAGVLETERLLFIFLLYYQKQKDDSEH